MTLKKTKISCKIIPLLFLSLIACAQKLPADSSKNGDAVSKAVAGSWLMRPAVYRLRQSATLEYRDKKEILEGFMELDTQKNRAHLVIFTALGVTLLDIEIGGHSFKITQNSAACDSRKRRFAKAVAGAVQHIFLSLKEGKQQNSDSPPLQIRFSGSPAEISGLSPKVPHPDWEVSYRDYHEYPCGRLPQKIILKSRKPNYNLTLWLHRAREIKE